MALRRYFFSELGGRGMILNNLIHRERMLFPDHDVHT